MKHRLEVWGDFACFTRPEMKVERVSYEVITPSAARAIFEAILWNPSIRWHIEKIQVLHPIKWINVRRNEISSKASPCKEICIEEERVQRSSLILKNPAYIIHAKLESLSNDSVEEKKFNSMFLQRALKGQCFTQPYFGCREFSCYFQLAKKQNSYQFIPESRDLGWMLYDMQYNSKEIIPLFFQAYMNNGEVVLPSRSKLGVEK